METRKISIKLSTEMLEKVDQEASKLGTTRGAMLTTWIGEKINALEQSRAFMNQLMKEETLRKLRDFTVETEARIKEGQTSLFDSEETEK